MRQKLLLPLFLILLFVGMSGGVLAQDETLLILETDSPDMQTGQVYDVRVRIGDVTNLWAADFTISYDPTMLYVMGKVSGRPVRNGDLFPPETRVTVRNAVQGSRIVYTTSLVFPQPPITGSGVLATFRVYPLKAGTTQLQFVSGGLRSVIFTNGEPSDPEPINFVPVLLSLNITGDTVEPPDEATPTPAPTDTPTPVTPDASDIVTLQPTLVNVTLTPTVASIELLDVPSTDDQPASDNTLLVLAIGLIVMGGGGLILLLMMNRRRS